MKEVRVCHFRLLRLVVLIIFVVVLLSTSVVYSQDDLDEDTSQAKSPAALQVVAHMLYNQIANVTHVFEPDIRKHLGFCIKDVYVI